jgi:hypothetical protein
MLQFWAVRLVTLLTPAAVLFTITDLPGFFWVAILFSPVFVQAKL